MLVFQFYLPILIQPPMFYVMLIFTSFIIVTTLIYYFTIMVLEHSIGTGLFQVLPPNIYIKHSSSLSRHIQLCPHIFSYTVLPSSLVLVANIYIFFLFYHLIYPSLNHEITYNMFSTKINLTVIILYSRNTTQIVF